jgi:AcrR family transcriptional regulator
VKTNPKKTRDYHHGELRPALLRAAVELVNERGDGSFGLRDLASRVGVSHPALYRHFADRAALFHAVAIEGFSLYAKTQQMVMSSSPDDPEEQLIRLGRNHLTFALEHPGYFRVMFGAQIGEHKLADESLNKVARPTLEIIATVASAFGKPEPLDFALCLWSSVHGIALLGLNGQLTFFSKTTTESVHALAEQSARYMIAGYKASV